MGAAGVGMTYVGLRTAFDDDFDLYNVGAARFVCFEYTQYGLLKRTPSNKK